MKKVLVTGGVGFVGTTLCNMLTAQGCEVCVIDNFTYGEERKSLLTDSSKIEMHNTDLLDEAATLQVFESFQPDVFIHLAAIHFIPECNRRPVFATMSNVVATEKVLNCARKCPTIKRTITISSAAVYPISDEALSHDFTPAPTDIYGITKAANEEQSNIYATETGVETVCVRLFNVFGQYETNPHLIPEVIDQIKEGTYDLKLGNVEPKRSYIHVEDVANALIALSQCDLEQAYTCVNLGHDEETSVKDVVDIIREATGLPLTIVQDPARVRKSDRMYLRCDSTYLNKLTGWRPQYGIKDGLRKLLELEGVKCL